MRAKIKTPLTSLGSKIILWLVRIGQMTYDISPATAFLHENYVLGVFTFVLISHFRHSPFEIKHHHLGQDSESGI